ncbi:MAG: radical SAM protein [Cryobacterium sp.]|nr:radical SAM protein [Oligoflexia bacterium]
MSVVEKKPKKRYSKVNVEISNICNLQCSFCPEVQREKGMMTTELFRQVISQVAPLTDQVCLHLMGDPLVHPRLEDFLEICAKAAVPVFFVSNGVLLREKQAGLLLHPIIRQVNFSLHSFHDNYPDRDPSLYLERIFSFTERAFAQRPDLYVNFRLWNLEETRGECVKNRAILKRVFDRFASDENLAELETSALSVDVTRKKSIRIQQRLYLHFDTEFVWPSIDLPVLGETGTCHGLSNHFGILMNGTVVPCCLDKEGAIPLGVIGEKPLGEILGGTRASEILNGFRNRKLTEELCRRCQYIERFGT